MKKIDSDAWLRAWELLAPIFGEWLDALMRKWLADRGKKLRS